MSHGSETRVRSRHLTIRLSPGERAAIDHAADRSGFTAGSYARQVLRDALRCPDLDWERGRAWAFEQALGLVWYYAETNPVMSGLGRTTLDRIVSGR